MSDTRIMASPTTSARRVSRSRRVGSLVAALLLAGAGLTGCSADGTNADDDAPGVDTPADQPTDDASSDDAEAGDTADDADADEPEAEDDAGAVAVPEGLPDEIPLPQERLIQTRAAGEKGWMLTYEVDMDDDQVLERYQTQMTDAGFAAEIGTPTDANLTATGSEWMVTVARNHGSPRMNITVIID